MLFFCDISRQFSFQSYDSPFHEPCYVNVMVTLYVSLMSEKKKKNTVTYTLISLLVLLMRYKSELRRHIILHLLLFSSNGMTPHVPGATYGTSMLVLFILLQPCLNQVSVNIWNYV